MKFLEKNLEEILFNADHDQLKKRGFYPPSKHFKRQLKVGNYGIADLVYFRKVYDYDWDSKGNEMGIYPMLEITVCELKRSKVGISAFLQAIRYARGIQSYFHKNTSIDVTLSVIVMGSSVDVSDFVYMIDLLGNTDTLNAYTYTYDFDGIKFKSLSGYKLKDEGFKPRNKGGKK